jgi:spore germination protein KA/spore germination protein
LELSHNYRIIEDIKAKGVILNERTISFKDDFITIYFIRQLTDQNALSEEIIRPLVQYSTSDKKHLLARFTMENVIYSAECQIESDSTKIEDHILNGMAVIIFSSDDDYLIANIKKVEHRQVSTPEIAYTIRGPRDCFVEYLDVNLSLIRYRIKDPNLRIDNFEVGKRTKTSVAVIYIKDIANDNVVNEIKKRISKIDIDSIWGTGELQHFLKNNKYDLFPLFSTTERSDWGCEAIIDGRVLILADGGQMGIIAPQTFGGFLISCDDRYDNTYISIFSVTLRYIALFLTLCFSSIYIAIVTFHNDVLPASFIIFIAEMRQIVLFAPLIEVLIVEFLIELIRESLLRVPTKIGTAIGIVGAIVIGQAATSAGVFSPLLLIIEATALMSSFAIPDYFGIHPIRILKLFIILMTGFFGFYGFVVGLTMITLNLVSIDSFGVPYMAPAAPFNLYDFIRGFFFSRSMSPKRQHFLRDKDETRTQPREDNTKF